MTDALWGLAALFAPFVPFFAFCAWQGARRLLWRWRTR